MVIEAARQPVMSASDIEIELNGPASSRQDGDTTCSESERLKKRGNSRAVFIFSFVFLVLAILFYHSSIRGVAV